MKTWFVYCILIWPLCLTPRINSCAAAETETGGLRDKSESYVSPDDPTNRLEILLTNLPTAKNFSTGSTNYPTRSAVDIPESPDQRLASALAGLRGSYAAYRKADLDLHEKVLRIEGLKETIADTKMWDIIKSALDIQTSQGKQNWLVFDRSLREFTTAYTSPRNKSEIPTITEAAAILELALDDRIIDTDRGIQLLVGVASVNPYIRPSLQVEMYRLIALELKEQEPGVFSRTGLSKGLSLLARLAVPGDLDELRDVRIYRAAIAYLKSEPNPKVRFLMVTTEMLPLCNLVYPKGKIDKALIGDDEFGRQGALNPRTIGIEGDDLAHLYGFLDAKRASQAQRLETKDLQGRVDALERELRAFEQETRQSFVRLDEAVTNLERRVSELEKWRVEVDAKLRDLEERVWNIETFGAEPMEAKALKANAGDEDRDQIDDRLEAILIGRYSPVFQVGDHGRPPCSARWFLQHSFLRSPSGVVPRETWKNDPLTSFMPLYNSLAQTCSPDSMRLQLADESFRNGESDIPNEQLDWNKAKQERNLGMYAHVVRGRIDGEFLIQYFMMLTWNETAYSEGFGNHEADWLAVTLCVHCPGTETIPWFPLGNRDPASFSAIEWTNSVTSRVVLDRKKLDDIIEAISSDQSARSLVKWVRMCNHGRYIDMHGQNLEWTVSPDGKGGAPKFYLEAGTHEVWPNKGGRGYSGWPNTMENGEINSTSDADYDTGPRPPWRQVARQFSRDGSDIDAPVGGGNKEPWINEQGLFRISFDFGKGEFFMGINEHKVAREHGGNGITYETAKIPNLGELSRPLSREADLILNYRGLWGGWWKKSESPAGPWKEEMWIGCDKETKRKAAEVDPKISKSPIAQN